MSQTFQAEPEEKRGCGLSRLAVGCLVVFAVCVVLCGIAGYVVQKYGKPFAVAAVETMASEAIDDSELSDEEKAAVKAEISRVAEAYKSGEITLEDVGEVVEALMNGPLFVLAMVEAAKQRYIVPSGLEQQEKDDASLTLQRTGRGVIDEKIDPDDLEDAVRYIAKRDAEGNWQFRDQADVTDDDLRSFLAECNQLADDADIPEEEYQVDIGAEFKKAVDEALSR